MLGSRPTGRLRGVGLGHRVPAQSKAMEKPICLIENKFKEPLKINQEALRLLQDIQQPVVVVAIVGLYRTGKSYLMNKLAGKNKGFSLGSTIQANTTGIWMWCLPHPKKHDHTLVLLDTEGLGDVEKSNTENDTWIFALSVLLSSTLVYNSMNTIDQGALEKLQFFPAFIWAVRDFYLELELNGHPISADEYLENALWQKKDNPEKLDLAKKCIRQYFPSRKCFVFDRPATTREELKNLENLPESKLSPGFVEEMDIFCQYIYKNAEAKVIQGGHVVTGTLLGNLAVTYVDSIRSGTVPCIENAVLALAQIENSAAVQEAIKHYEDRKERLLKLPTETVEELLKVHSRCVKEAIKVFMARSFNDEGQEYQKQLRVSRLTHWWKCDCLEMSVLMDMSLSGKRLPLELFDPEDVSLQSDRELPRWFTDVKSSQLPRRSRSQSRGACDRAEAHHFCHRYARLPSPETYARRYYASRGLSDSRSPYVDSGYYKACRDYAVLSPPALPRQSPVHSRPTPLAVLGAPSQTQSPLEPADPPPPPDLTREESSVDSTDHESEDSDSNQDDTIPIPADRISGNLAVYRHLMGPKCSYSLRTVCAKHSRRFDALYKIQPGEAKFLVSHPTANSLMVHSASKAKQAKHPIPPDREGRKLDTLGRKLYSIATTESKLHNYLAHFLAYAYHLADQFKPYLKELPEEFRNAASTIIEELTQLSCQQINTMMLESKLRELCSCNERASLDRCQALLTQLFQDLEKKIARGIYAVPGGYQQFLNDQEEQLEKYQQAPGKGLMASRALRDYLKSQETVAQSILKADYNLTQKEKEAEVERVRAQAAEQEAELQRKLTEETLKMAEEKEKSFEEHKRQLLAKMEEDRKNQQLEYERMLSIKLQMMLESKLWDLCSCNTQASLDRCQALLTQLFQVLEKKIASGIYAGCQQFLNDLKERLGKYQRAPGKGLK
ncbi:UNVERIFIED_CONTAM: hypothetical protein K2H54_030401, partial [Gekko kuhli]